MDVFREKKLKKIFRKTFGGKLKSSTFASALQKARKIKEVVL